MLWDYHKFWFSALNFFSLVVDNISNYKRNSIKNVYRRSKYYKKNCGFFFSNVEQINKIYKCYVCTFLCFDSRAVNSG